MPIPLVDAGSIAALLVALDRGYARWTQLRRNQMEQNQPETPAADPYAGARAMGITVPAPVPAPEDGDPKPTGVTGDDYAQFLKWKSGQAGTESAVTVTPEAEAATPKTTEALPALPDAGPVQTPLSGRLRGIASDVIDVIQAIEAAESE